MAFTSRGRRQAYDNIAAGSTTGYERTRTDTVSRFERYGGGFYTSTSTGDAVEGHSNVAAGQVVTDDDLGPENIIVAGTAFADENVG